MNIMKIANSRRSLPSLLAVVVAVAGGAAPGCTGTPAPDPDTRAAPAAPNLAPPPGTPGAPLTAFRLTRSPRSQVEIARSGAALAGVLSGRSLPASELQAALVTAGPAPESLDVSVASRPGISLSYRADNDRRLVIDEAVISNMAAADIGKDAAHTVFLAAFRSAVSSGALPATGLDPAAARSSRIVQGEGVSGQAPIERTSEYIFTVPRTINGVEVFDAGFEVSVHRAGQLARVQAFGPSVASTVAATGAENPDASGYSVNRAVAVQDLASRVAAEYPAAEIKPIGVRYWLPAGITSAVVEPTQMYFVVPTAAIAGENIKARGFFVAYSLTTPGQAATVWPVAEHNPTGDGRK